MTLAFTADGAKTAGNNGFRPCEPCAGFGFVRGGSFASRSFSKCTVCGGCGQFYLHPTPAPLPDKG